MKKYTVVSWCNDCIQEDFLGCFDGGYEYDYFETLEEAKEFIKKCDFVYPLEQKVEESIK